MTASFEQPRFLNGRENDIEAALGLLSDPTTQEGPVSAPKANGASGGGHDPSGIDDVDAERLSLKTYLDSTWSEGAAFGKWLQDAAHRMKLDVRLP